MAQGVQLPITETQAEQEKEKEKRRRRKKKGKGGEEEDEESGVLHKPGKANKGTAGLHSQGA